MTVWGEMMKNIQPEPLQPVVPEEIEMVNVDPVSGQRYNEDCKTGMLLPFIKGSAPTEITACAFPVVETPKVEEAAVIKTDVKPEVKPEVKKEPEKKNWFQRLVN
jgi:penicillin-binding protein 1B